MPRKVIVVSHLPPNHREFIVFARHVVTRLTGNLRFPNLPVALAELTALIDALEAAEISVEMHVKGAAEDRDAKRTKVEAALHQEQAYVESVAQQVPPEDVEAAVNSSGFSVKKQGKHTKPAYEVTRGDVSGTADLDVKSLGRNGTVMYCHQYSLDNAKTWIDAVPTIETATSITGLPIGQTVSFRFRTLVKGAYGDWSQIITFLVY
ncbi:MAG: hypothetical protein WCI05_17215 [Myxococcales bacterium]